MAKKKDGKSIILPTAGKMDNENLWDGEDWDDEDEWDEEDMDGVPEELMSIFMNQLLNGMSGGMTNEQYKGMLLDQLENWKRVKKLAEEEGAKKTAAEAQAQIAVINKKLKY